jgi:hypothetical protein
MEHCIEAKLSIAGKRKAQDFFGEMAESINIISGPSQGVHGQQLGMVHGGDLRRLTQDGLTMEVDTRHSCYRLAECTPPTCISPRRVSVQNSRAYLWRRM